MAAALQTQRAASISSCPPFVITINENVIPARRLPGMFYRIQEGHTPALSATINLRVSLYYTTFLRIETITKTKHLQSKHQFVPPHPFHELESHMISVVFLTRQQIQFTLHVIIKTTFTFVSYSAKTSV